jgi:hypothetical protein
MQERRKKGTDKHVKEKYSAHELTKSVRRGPPKRSYK